MKPYQITNKKIQKNLQVVHKAYKQRDVQSLLGQTSCAGKVFKRLS